MTTTTPTTASAPPTVAPSVRPAWTTTAFWTTMLTHVVAIVTVVLTLAGRGEDLSAVEVALPLVALLVSSAVTVLYRRDASRTKLLEMAHFTGSVVADIERIAPLLEKDAKVLEPVVETLDPAAMARLREASAAWSSIKPAVPEP